MSLHSNHNLNSLDMEVVVAVAPPPPTVDFNFDSNCSTPYITAPSSPQRFGNLFSSAPTSPTRVSTFIDQLNNFTTTHSSSSSSSSSIPFQWEQQPGVPRPQHNNNNSHEFGHDFEFNFNSAHLEPPPLSAADELFDCGKIKPLKPPPRLQSGEGITSPRSPRKGKKIFSPRHNQKTDIDSDPFAMALKETRRREEQPLEQRGRERVSSSSGRKVTRSLSPPLRVSDVMFESEEKVVSSRTSNTKSSSSYASFLSSIPFTKGYRKWRLKDFLLFRSASEGRATDKDPLRNFEVLSKKAAIEEDVRNSSFRSNESSGSVSSRRRAPVSAHELHYTMNRAASEEMKKKTLLPYKQGLLGCLGLNPGMNQISTGIGSFTSRS